MPQFINSNSIEDSMPLSHKHITCTRQTILLPLSIFICWSLNYSKIVTNLNTIDNWVTAHSIANAQNNVVDYQHYLGNLILEFIWLCSLLSCFDNFHLVAPAWDFETKQYTCRNMPLIDCKHDQIHEMVRCAIS